MMESISSVGLVLRRVRHLDSDFKLTILLRDFGKVAAISKGGQRLLSKLKAVQEPFSEGDFQLFVPPHGTNGRLTGGRLINSHQNLRQNYEAFNAACRCCEVVEMLLPFRAPSPDVYDILRESLQSLQSSGSPKPSPLHDWVLFIVQILKVLGHGDVSEQASRYLADAPLERCVTFVEAELERILPWRLKSAVEVQ
jgi:DNA repair protein RecO